MKAHRLAVKLMSLGVLLFAGILPAPENLSAQACEYSWPVVTMEWRLGPDSYYSSGQVGADVNLTCTACACTPVTTADCAITIDGQAENCSGTDIPFSYLSGVLPEGAHTVNLQFSMRSYATGETTAGLNESKTFYVDKTPPVITSTKPAAGVVISTADLTMSGSVSDTASKIRAVNLGLSVESGGCQVRKGTSTALSQGLVWHYCNSEVYDPEYCDENIGIPPDFTLNRDLRDYIVFTSTLTDCRLVISAAAWDRIGNGSSMPEINFTIDQAAPVISISTWPGRGVPAFISSPAIAGLAADSSEIQYMKLKLFQNNSLRDETCWNGAGNDVLMSAGTVRFL